MNMVEELGAGAGAGAVSLVGRPYLEDNPKDHYRFEHSQMVYKNSAVLFDSLLSTYWTLPWYLSTQVRAQELDDLQYGF